MNIFSQKILPVALAFLLVLLTIPVSAERNRDRQRSNRGRRQVKRQQSRPQRQVRSRPQRRQQQRMTRRRPQRQQRTRRQRPQRSQQRMTRQRPQRQQQRMTRRGNQRQQQRMTRRGNQRQQQRMTRRGNQRQQQRMTRRGNQRQQQRMTRRGNQRQQQRMTRRGNQRQQQRMTRRGNQRQQQRMTRRRNQRQQQRLTSIQPQRQQRRLRRGSRIVRQAPVINYNYNVRPRRAYFPRYTQNCAPGFYSDFRVRRRFRRNRNCLIPLLTLGFFLTRPYSTYNYAQVGYDQPFFYGQDDAYQPVPENLIAAENAVGIGGPATQTAAAASADTSSLIDTKVPEQVMISELSRYVDAQSKDGRFVIQDGAFGNQAWNLELAQAPAVYKIAEGKYSVVAGFEGTLGESPIPSNVALEFFMSQNPEGWSVQDVWIISANGIPRTKQFQSPVHPEVKTWSEGAVCPFSGQPMIPVSDAGAQHG